MNNKTSGLLYALIYDFNRFLLRKEYNIINIHYDGLSNGFGSRAENSDTVHHDVYHKKYKIIKWKN